MELRVKKRLIGLGILSAVVLCVFFVFYWPLVQKNFTLGLSVDEVERNVRLAENLIKSYKINDSDFAMSEVQTASSVLQSVTHLAQENNIKFESIEPGEIVAHESSVLKRLPIRITFVANIKNTGNFLEALRNIKVGIVIVDSLKTKREERVMPFIQTNVLMDVYFYGG